MLAWLALVLRRTAASKAARAARLIRKPFSRSSAGNASLPGRPPCPTSSARPSPAASRRAAAHDAVISTCALPRRDARVARSCLAPHRGFQSCPGRAPNSQTVLPFLRRQRLAARSAALPHVFCTSVARGLTARCCARCCDLDVRLATPRCSCGSLLSCAAPRLPKLPSRRAAAHDAVISTCALPRRDARVARSCLAPHRGFQSCPHGALLRTML